MAAVPTLHAETPARRRRNERGGGRRCRCTPFFSDSADRHRRADLRQQWPEVEAMVEFLGGGGSPPVALGGDTEGS